MKQPLISICIPTYNRAKLLIRAVKSVLEQDYDNYEIIISDNCSTDDTEEQVKANFEGNTKVKYFRNTENVGMVPNWRLCLERASGEYYSILDDDNYFIYSDYLSDAGRVLSDNNNISLIFGDFIIRFQHQDILCKYTLDKITHGKKLYADYFKYKKVPQIFFVILNREIALKNNFYLDNLISHDVQAFLLSMLAGDVAYIRRVTGIYDLTNGDTVVSTIHLKWKDYINYCDRIIEYGKNNSISPGFITAPLKRRAEPIFYSDSIKTKEDKDWLYERIKSLFGSLFLQKMILKTHYNRMKHLISKLWHNGRTS